MSGRAWPTSLDYLAAVRNPGSAFLSPDLRSARFNVGTAEPKSIQGQRAIVILGHADEGPIAVRCLKRPLDGGAERYAALGAYLAGHPLDAIVWADWRENGIRVGEHTWPVVKMEQVVGPPLLVFVEKNLSDPARLRSLAGEWRQLVSSLSRAGVAHGDLQQDNVMLADEEHLRLVDLDAVWLPTLSELPPKERGHRNFQHPERLHKGYWGRYVDTFPALVIYISLRALAADPDLFGEFNNEENLIFCDEDFARPGKTPLWPRLWASPDLELRDMAGLLERCCQRTVQLGVDLDTLLGPGGIPADAASWTTPEIALTSAPWWPSTATAAPATAPPVADAGREWWQVQPEATTRPSTPAKREKSSSGTIAAVTILLSFMLVIVIVVLVLAAHH